MHSERILTMTMNTPPANLKGSSAQNFIRDLAEPITSAIGIAGTWVRCRFAQSH